LRQHDEPKRVQAGQSQRGRCFGLAAADGHDAAADRLADECGCVRRQADEKRGEFR
jgi:hypothetical protein